MTDKIVSQGQPIEKIDRTSVKPKPRVDRSDKPFKDILSAEIAAKDGLKFSAHAKKRLEMRNIDLTRGDYERIHSGVSKAAAKGSRESLILLEDLAFVVSVKNRTVITAVDGDNLKENVFTNIDSAVIM